MLAAVAAELGVTPAEMAGWQPLAADVRAPELEALDAAPFAYEARCFPAPPPIPPPAASPAWGTDLDAALSGGRRVLLRFHAAWSAADTHMDSEVWSDAGARAVIDRCFVPVAIDMSAPSAGALAKRFRVAGIPAWVVLTGDGQAVAPPVLGYVSASELEPALTGLCGP